VCACDGEEKAKENCRVEEESGKKFSLRRECGYKTNIAFRLPLQNDIKWMETEEARVRNGKNMNYLFALLSLRSALLFEEKKGKPFAQSSLFITFSRTLHPLSIALLTLIYTLCARHPQKSTL
jgi:hypothetical protein